MTISHVHIYYPGAIDPTTGTVSSQTRTWVDLRAVVSASTGDTIGSTVTINARVKGLPTEGQFIWSKTEFETAKAASLTAGG